MTGPKGSAVIACKCWRILFLLALLVSGCRGTSVHRDDPCSDVVAGVQPSSADETSDGDASRGTDTVALLLFPINVVPNIIVNTGAMILDPVISGVLGKDPGTLYGVVLLISPIAGPYQGIVDALDGCPFWDTWMVRHYRTRRDLNGHAPAAETGDAGTSRR